MKFSNANIGCLTLLLLPMMMASVIFCYGTVRAVIKAVDTNNWVKTKATIETLDVRTDIDEYQTYSYKILPVYTYSVNGKTYEGKKVAIAYGSTKEKTYHSIMKKLGVAKSIMVYVNPSNPQESVIIKGFNVKLLWGFIMSFIFGGSFLMILSPLYIGKKDQKEMNEIFIKTSG